MIYLDLDNTLIDCRFQFSPKNNRINVKMGKEWYGAIERPLAKYLISECRKISEVKILTMAARDYALIWNSKFNFGFKIGDVIGREDFIWEVDGHYFAIDNNVDKNAILIDNEDIKGNNARLKREYLGIPRENYVQIREFKGKDPDCFADELEEILRSLQNK